MASPQLFPPAKIFQRRVIKFRLQIWIRQQTLPDIDNWSSRPRSNGAAVSHKNTYTHRRRMNMSKRMTQKPWNQKFADDKLCAYCGSNDWDRAYDVDWDNGRQQCACTSCGAEWWEGLTSTPKIPSLVHKMPRGCPRHAPARLD